MQNIESLRAGLVFVAGKFDFEGALTDKVLIPVILNRVSAGFPSPADDYIESRIDLNHELIRHPFATFFVRAAGDSMIDAGIHAGTTLIVDRQVETRCGDIVIARIGDELCVKELFIDDEDGSVILLPRNDNYQPIIISEDMDFEIWGKVIVSFNRH